jgi:hypothetical protein
MPLNDNLLKQNIISITDTMMQQEDYESSKEVYADMLVAAIKAYLTTGTVTITGTSNQGPFTGTGIIS